MSNSLRLAPLDTSSVGSNVVYMHPPISPPPRFCSWRSNSPISILTPPPPLPSPSIRIDALTISEPPSRLVPPSVLPIPSLPVSTSSSSPSLLPPPQLTPRFPPLLSASPATPLSESASPSPPAVSTESSSLQSAVSKSRTTRRKRSRAVREVFRCTFKNCDKVSSENSNLKAHMRLHTGETPYVCHRPGCGKRFRWKSSLTYHEKALHSNLRPFACESCEKRFVEKRKLQLHRDWCPTMRQQQAALKARNLSASSTPLMLMRTTSPIAVPVYHP